MLNNNIYLIGFMGSGKSHWGQVWSHEYRIPLLELDEAIIQEAGMSISRIFDLYGEDRFRKLERQELHQTEGVPYKLVSCGGGVPCFFDNMDWMLANGIVIYLKANPDQIYDRIKDEIANRPLLSSLQTADDIKGYIRGSLEKRKSYYERAHHIWEVDDVRPNSIDSFIN